MNISHLFPSHKIVPSIPPEIFVCFKIRSIHSKGNFLHDSNIENAIFPTDSFEKYSCTGPYISFQTAVFYFLEISDILNVRMPGILS